MNNLSIKSGEYVNVKDLVETDIFQMLMDRDRVKTKEFLKMCDDTSRELGQYRSSSAA